MASSSIAGAHKLDGSKGVDQDVLSRIRHLDVTAHITDRSQETVAHGGYCEVFTGRLHRVGYDQVHVAIKRLRFHVDETNVEKAGSLVPPFVACVSS